MHDPETMTDRYAKFYAQPFERGYGTTIGNSLRRILMSSIPGGAITAVKIDGVLHEFSSLRGVSEDVSDIVLNLKRVPLKMTTSHIKLLTLEKTGPGVVTSGDIQAPADVYVLDPNVHIATLGEDGAIRMEMRVEMNRGYVPAEENFDEDLELGYIPLDSVHSPIVKANYTVEAARLGQATDYDKLILEVWTNGAITPVDAVALAAKILKDHMSLFINFEEDDEEKESEITEEDSKLNDYLQKSVDELELSVRSYNCLKNAEIRTIADLVLKTESEMLKTKNFGRKSLNEIKNVLTEMGLAFGMVLDREGKILKK
ncbi:MAG: DNA-directed RNA polymerase subunit alpha [Acidobacteria bacterium]|nr:DNA-directed RNA polymerase subunit alpha [Acidobacteriota bacterium]